VLYIVDIWRRIDGFQLESNLFIGEKEKKVVSFSLSKNPIIFIQGRKIRCDAFVIFPLQPGLLFIKNIWIHLVEVFSCPRISPPIIL